MYRSYIKDINWISAGYQGYMHYARHELTPLVFEPRIDYPYQRHGYIYLYHNLLDTKGKALGYGGICSSAKKFLLFHWF